MHKGFLKTAAILTALTVALGAFAAHQLKATVSDDAVAIFETAVRYQFYHVFALFLTAIVYKEYPVKTVRIAGYLFIAGNNIIQRVFIFSHRIESNGFPGLQMGGRHYTYRRRFLYRRLGIAVRFFFSQTLIDGLAVQADHGAVLIGDGESYGNSFHSFFHILQAVAEHTHIFQVEAFAVVVDP
jgi:hypothetical protein